MPEVAGVLDAPEMAGGPTVAADGRVAAVVVGDDDRAAVVALSGLPAAGPARLRALLARGSAAEQWAAIAAGRLEPDPDLVAACAGTAIDRILTIWREAAASVDPTRLLARHAAADIAVLVAGDPDWPPAFMDDPDPPAVLYVRGDPVHLRGAAPAAAVVGTRNCTRYGWDVAHRLGAELAAAGVIVVSGLASGIDGAAHRGALDVGAGAGAGGSGEAAAPIGVVASGLDIVYPRGHGRLWREVASAGVLLSEAPLGTRPTRWRFPARNRIIAALSGVVVVVESAVTGGAMHTVDEAERRDRPVLAVPGPVTSAVSAGTNRLLADGAAPACDADDVLLALDVARPRGRPGSGPASSGPGAAGATGAEARPDGEAGQLLDVLGWRPATLDQLVLRSGLGLARVAGLAAELEADGWIAADGGWFERRR